MDLGAFIKSLEHKTILITGSTGFIAKVFMEKILRVQPNVKKLFLLIRAEDDGYANQRLQKDVMEKEIFRVLKEEHGKGFDEFISHKISVVQGDISLKNLGVKDSTLLDELWKEINFIFNVAATTRFDERYDVAMSINAMGAKHVGEFARRCAKLHLLVHVSTAFVCREKQGLILEKTFQIGDTFNGSPTLDNSVEFQLVEETLKELQQKKFTDKEVKNFMTNLGMQRAALHGWSNTYVFTKAIGEMIIGLIAKEVPMVIVRPTIVTSTYKEPFPGWIEGFRNVDPMIGSYGKGKLRHFLGDPKGKMDAIPVDMVVNAILAIMATHCGKGGKEVIYHVSSSLPNPLRWSNLPDWGYQYFLNNPLSGPDGKPIKVSRATLIPNLATFYWLLGLRYKLPLTALYMIKFLPAKIVENKYNKLNRKYKLLVRLGELYFSISKFKATFDASNLERIRSTRKNGTETFYFDPKCIDWDDYFANVHIPGIVKYVIK